MPATEKTWREQKWMHVVFGVSALVMLAATVWMLEQDHNREWRKWQIKDRAKEQWALQSHLAAELAGSHAKLVELEEQLMTARTQSVDRALVNRFKQLVQAEDQRLTEDGHPPKSQAPELQALDQAMDKLDPVAETAGQHRQTVASAREAAREALTAKLNAEAEETQSQPQSQSTDATPTGDQAETKLAELKTAQSNRRTAEKQAVAARKRLIGAMNTIIGEAKRREDALTVQKKFAAAKHTARVSEHGLAVGEGRPQAHIDKIQDDINELAASMSELDANVAAAKEYRVALESIRREVQAGETETQKQLDAITAELARIKENRDKNTWNAGEWITRQPILNALYDGNVRIDQIWLPDILIDYNFSSVPRYDRCTTCHRSIDKTAPGSAVEPAYPAIPKDQRDRTVVLPAPNFEPQAQVSADGKVQPATLASVYGFALAPEGQVDSYAVTIQYVAAETPAAIAGLKSGDVIRAIDGGRVYTEKEVESQLLSRADQEQPFKLSIRRGLDQPFTSHPRLDLFVGSMSPHKKGEMGCTICHDGQGSATDFKWASHTPNDPDTALEWSRRHGWFNNHHWIFPMKPERFIESNCLKCHHEVVELEPSERFPDPPAPKLVKGYHLIREYGCYGCHETNGYEGPDHRIGPDLRLEPNFHEVAAAVLRDEGLSQEEKHWASTLVGKPEADEIRQQLYRAIKRDEQLTEAGDDSEQQARLRLTTHELAELLKDVESPGKLRKVGPSLRHLRSKVDYEWLYSWIRQPSDFRPTTRMPQFFGLHEHLEKHRAEFPDAQGNPESLTDKQYTERFEAIEIRALAEFLLANSTDFTYLEPPSNVTEAPSAERGKWLFQSRGCLACHSHKEFPGIASTQGPDLSSIAAKFDSDKGRQWLYSWLKEPNRYHARTVMPDLFLDPIEQKDAAGEPTGQVTDPAADIMAFLLNVPPDWQPHDVPPRELSPAEQKALEDLTTEWLSASFPRRRAERYVREGIDARQGANIKGDESVLVGMSPNDPAQRQQKLLEYVARRSISRYGCFGCHDIPGYEAAKPIGTSLTEWGRKEPEKLAFENVAQFLATHGVSGNSGGAADEHHGEGGGHHGLNPLDHDDDTGYYLQALNNHQRQGFIWQKLRMPRSYDYEKNRNKRYDERLRMPKFPLDDQQREAVITFVLGLVNEAPAPKYVYKPDARQEAIVQGRHVLEKYNCAGCHMMEMERWDFAFEPDWFLDPPVMPEYPFLRPNVSSGEIENSLKIDRRGRMHAVLHGMPVRNEETGKAKIVDIDGVPIEPDDNESEPFYEFSLYRDAVVSGASRQVGVQNLLIPAKRDSYGPARGQAYPGWGGDLAKYLFPHVIAEEHKSNPQAKGSEAWGWLPPPLIGEGKKVQTDWLHGFLMDPHPIRPAVVMRMPNFHMSSDEASKLVNYFAANDDAQWPYEYNHRRREGYIASAEANHPDRMADAMKIVTDGNYCVKCHAVGDFEPKGALKTLGPQLADVYQRLRPSYVRNWVANPRRILPYTGMPVNIPFADNPPHFGGVSQDLYPGTSAEQLDGLVDLLMNFDEYAKRKTTIKSMVKDAPPEDAEQAADSSQPGPDQSARK